MFNLNSIVRTFNLTQIAVDSFVSKEGYEFNIDPNYVPNFANDSIIINTYIDAEDLFYSLVEWNEFNLVRQAKLTLNLVYFLARLAKAERTTEYSLEQLLSFVTKYEDNCNRLGAFEVKYFATVRKELSNEFARLGTDKDTLGMLFSVASQSFNEIAEACCLSSVSENYLIKLAGRIQEKALDLTRLLEWTKQYFDVHTKLLNEEESKEVYELYVKGLKDFMKGYTNVTYGQALIVFINVVNEYSK